MPPLILVVDDQPGVRRLIHELFQEAGYRVQLAAHGQEALTLVSAERPDLILLDMKMPVMDGLETLRALKAKDYSLTIFMMTAVGDLDRFSEAISNGALSCIGKPFDVFALRNLVQETLEGMMVPERVED